jgi:hypothetical protein
MGAGIAQVCVQAGSRRFLLLLTQALGHAAFQGFPLAVAVVEAFQLPAPLGLRIGLRLGRLPRLDTCRDVGDAVAVAGGPAARKVGLNQVVKPY